jgi:hypothetical protein
MRLMGTDKRRINSAVRVVLIGQVAEQELAIDPEAGQELAIDPEAGQELAIDPVAERELAIDPVAERALAIDPEAERALAIAQVVAELERDPVVGQELAIALVPAGPEPGPQRGRLAVAPRTKLVTGARRRDLVPIVAAALAVVAAETTRVPAATEAAVA